MPQPPEDAQSAFTYLVVLLVVLTPLTLAFLIGSSLLLSRLGLL